MQKEDCTIHISPRLISAQLCRDPGGGGTKKGCTPQYSVTCTRMLAESEGFEPPVACTTTDFESAAFVHSANSPQMCGKGTIFFS